MELTSVLSYVFFFVMGLLIFVVGIPFLFVMNKENKEPDAAPQSKKSEQLYAAEPYIQSAPYYVSAQELMLNEYIPVQVEYEPVEMYAEARQNSFNSRHSGPKYEIINVYSVPQQAPTRLKTWESNWK